MKIQKSKKRYSISIKKILLVILLILLSFLLILIVVYPYIKPSLDKQADISNNQTNTQTPNSQQNNTLQETAQNRESEKKPLQTVENPPSQSNNVSGVISYKNVNDGQLILRTTINQALSSGSCTLTMKNRDKTLTKSADIVQNPSSSSCMGFNIPISELTSGSWTINIKINSGTLSGEINDIVNI